MKKKEEKKRRRGIYTDYDIEKELYIYSLTNLPQTTHAHTMAASQAYFYIFISDVDFVCYVRENVILSRLM